MKGGNHSISAAYFGDNIYSGASDARDPLIFNIQIGNPGFLISLGTSFGLTRSGAGSTQTGAVTISSNGSGFVGTINATCSIVSDPAITTPVLPTCSLSPSSVTLGPLTQRQQMTLTLSTVQGTQALSLPSKHFGDWIGFGTVSFAGIFFLNLPSLRRRSTMFVALLASVSLFGCGGGGGGSSSSGQGSSNPPAQVSSGGYEITITGTSGTVTNFSTNQFFVH